MKDNLLKNWHIVSLGKSIVVCGDVYNDLKKRFVDGTFIHTSKVISIYFELGVVRTLNSIYNLELANDAEYEA